MSIFRIIIFSIVMFSSISQVGALSRSDSMQTEQEKIEKLRDKLQQLETGRERELLDNMNRAMEKYCQSKDDSSRQEYESLLDRALALPGPSAGVYSACATAANLLDRPRQAIAILKKAIESYPDEAGWETTVPLKVAGYYRIGSIAVLIGDPNEATQAYEAAIGNCRGFRIDAFCKVLCLMHLADIADRMLNDKQLAIKRSQEMVEEIDSVDKSELQSGIEQSLIFLKDWALYKRKFLDTGEVSSRDISEPIEDRLSLLSMTHLAISQCTIQESDKVIRDDSSSIDSILTRFALAFNSMHYEKTDEAEQYLHSITKMDSYFKVTAQAMLKILDKQRDMIRKRIPTFYKNLKNGNMIQRESAAHNLVRDPEGIKLLYEAQHDPNKYVRYAAACSIAKWNKYPAYKADFNIIIEALTDEDALIRKSAGDALGPFSSLEINSEKIVTVIELLNDHYSPELMTAIQRYMLSSRASEDILDAAVPALVKCLDKQDMEVQKKIIELLGRLGLNAKPAVPAINKYLDHEDANLRQTARTALRRISPARADELIKGQAD